MNKSELIDAIAAKADLSKVASGKALEAVLESIVQAVAKGDGVSLVGFGSFKSAARAAREGKNPKTGILRGAYCCVKSTFSTLF